MHSGQLPSAGHESKRVPALHTMLARHQGHVSRRRMRLLHSDGESEAVPQWQGGDIRSKLGKQS